jgi:hypothetical protein
MNTLKNPCDALKGLVPTLPNVVGLELAVTT